MGYSLTIAGNLADPRDEKAVHAVIERAAAEVAKLDAGADIAWVGDHTPPIRPEAPEADAVSSEDDKPTKATKRAR